MSLLDKWTPLLAYCVGLIATDGNLSKDGRHVDFTSKDIGLVEIIKTGFNSKSSIRKKHRGDGIKRYFRIQLADHKLYQQLLSMGLTPKKSLTLESLAIPDLFFADFLRGNLDGDGNITTYQDSKFPNSSSYTTRPIFLAFTENRRLPIYY